MSTEEVQGVYPECPFGRPGQPWNTEEQAEWLKASNIKQRDYFTDVVSSVQRFPYPGAEVFQYGEIDYRKLVGTRYPLYAVRSEPWDSTLPMVAVTGGVHGYETSGVHGALHFIHKFFEEYSKKSVNLLILPCVSPWGYEVIQRWTPEAIDPNRSFDPSNPGCPEAANAMRVIAEWAAKSSRVLMHVDLHETTDTDNSVFMPALFARDGVPPEEWSEIPDGFYTVSDAARPEPEFQKAIVDAVAQHTHIADPDEKGNIIGVPLAQHGVISYPGKNLCGNHTSAKYVTTTEVYPDSSRTTPEACNVAQAAVVTAGITYALAHP